MTTLIEAARQALEALETCMYPQQKQIQALTSLRQAIEQAEEKNCKNCVIDKPCIAKGKDMQICGAFVSKHAKELKQIALEKKAENARELGLDYEPVPWIENMTIDSTNELSKPTAPVQKPVAWWVNSGHEGDVLFDEAEACRYALTINGSVTPFYTTPQPMREWVSLTVDEIWEVYKKHGSLEYKAFARAIEQSLKEKNT